jgi:Smg protein
MKENIFDVLMYLFTNYLDEDYELTTDQESLHKILTVAGFEDEQIHRAFVWLERLAIGDEEQSCGDIASIKSHRVFNSQEMSKLGRDCRGLISYLEQADILDAHDRELVIDRVMALESGDIDLYQLKWVVLMVLMNQPGKEAAFTSMEGMLMEHAATELH